MIAKNMQKQQFQERLKRISSGGPNTASQIYAGSLVGAKPGKKIRRRKDKSTASRRGASLPVSLLSGLFIGALAVLLVRYGRFQLTGGALGGADADITMMADIVLAITLAILLRVVFRFRSTVHGFGKILGVVAMVLLMQNLVFAAPGLFERTFSVAWVDEVMATTQPNSVLLAGVTFTR